MSWSTLVRRIHRWVSVIFTAAVIIVAILTWTLGEPAGWIYVAPGLGLVLLLLTGLYLFVEPYAARWRRR